MIVLDTSGDYTRKGVLIISIDLEFAWGINYGLPRGLPSTCRYLKIVKRRSRRNVDKLLKFSERFNTPFTWGVVGGLLKSLSKNNFSSYLDILSKFKLNKDLYMDEKIWYGADIVEKIIESKVEHEIACHSFSHIDLSRCSRNTALKEIRKCKGVMRDYGVNPKTFIFPGNEIGYLDLLKQEGFKIFRLNGEGVCNNYYPRYFLHCTLANMVRDLLFPSIVSPILVNGLVGIPSSLYFQSPYNVDVFRMQVVAIRGINRAVERKEIFHITMHDYLETDLLLNIFLKVLSYAVKLRDQGKLNIETMNSYYDKLLNI